MFFYRKNAGNTVVRTREYRERTKIMSTKITFKNANEISERSGTHYKVNCENLRLIGMIEVMIIKDT